MASLEVKRIKTLKPEVKVSANVKIWYLNTFLDLILTQFSDLIYVLKASYVEYGRSTATEYYKILCIGHLYDKFVRSFFEKLK